MMTQTVLYKNLKAGMSQGDKGGGVKFNVTCSRGISAPFLLEANKEEVCRFRHIPTIIDISNNRLGRVGDK